MQNLILIIEDSSDSAQSTQIYHLHIIIDKQNQDS